MQAPADDAIGGIRDTFYKPEMIHDPLNFSLGSEESGLFKSSCPRNSARAASSVR